MHVTLVGGFDPATPSAGGVRGYVESVGRYLDSVGVQRLTIVAGPALEVGDRECRVPVRRGGSTFHFLSSLCVNIQQLPVPRDSLIHVQRPDELLPFMLANIGTGHICTLHGNPLQGIRQSRSPPIAMAYAITERYLLREAARVVFVDDGTAGEYRRRYPWLVGKSDVIPNGVDTSQFHPTNRTEARRRWGFSGTTLLLAGRLETEKRPVEVVRAFRQLGPAHATLVIAGDGRQRKLVELEAANAAVRLLGSVPRTDMPSLLSAVDALVQYSTREGLPSTILEALACGTPVIATPVGAVRSLLGHCEVGVLVTSFEELVDAMNRVCMGDLRASNSVAETVAPYSWKELGPRLLDSYARAQKFR